MNEQRHPQEGRVPPYSNEAEIAVLGSVLLRNDCLEVVRGIIKAGDFYNEVHRRVWDAMIEVRTKGEAIDAVTVGNALIQSGNLERVGGAMIFANLTDAVATTANVEHYAKIVKEKAAVRRVIYLAQEISATGFADHGAVPEFLAKARDSMIKATAIHDATGMETIGEGMVELFAELETSEPPPNLVKTGFKSIDDKVGGLWPGLLTIIAGRPHMGKSTFGLNIALNAAFAGRLVTYVTLEDTKYFLRKRALSRIARVNLLDLVLNRVGGNDWPRLIEAANKLSSLPLHIDQGPMNAMELAQLATTQKHTKGLDLLILDHLGFFRKMDPKHDEFTHVSESARVGADLAKELDIPTVFLHQLNRGVEGRPDKRPLLGDLRGSGKVEEDARAVWMLYRDEYYNKDKSEKPGILEVIMTKLTHGPTGVIDLGAELKYMRIRDLVDGPDEYHHHGGQTHMGYND